MRVLLISPKEDIPKGGIAAWTNLYQSECDAAGIESDIVNTALIGQRAKQANAKRNIADEIIRTRVIFKQLNSFLKGNGVYDVVHLNTSCGTYGIIRDYFLAKKVKRKNLKLVLQFHCDIPFWVKGRLQNYFLKKLLKKSDKNLVLCNSSKKFLKEGFNEYSEILPNCIEKKTIKKEPKIITEKIGSFLFVGRASKEKGILEFMRIAELFPSIRFDVIGEISEDVSGIPKPQNVHFLGIKNQAEVLALLDEADAFFFPTHSEGFSMALLEAMARGLPIIATDVGANYDMVENKGGIVIPKGDVDAMKNALKQLSDFSTRKKMSEWCINKVVDNYTTDKVMEKLFELYIKV